MESPDGTFNYQSRTYLTAGHPAACDRPQQKGIVADGIPAAFQSRTFRHPREKEQALMAFQLLKHSADWVVPGTQSLPA